MWSTWHNTVAVHSWRAKVNPYIDTNCKCCELGIEETPSTGSILAPVLKMHGSLHSPLSTISAGFSPLRDPIFVWTSFNVCSEIQPREDFKDSKPFGHCCEVQSFGRYGSPATARSLPTSSGPRNFFNSWFGRPSSILVELHNSGLNPCLNRGHRTGFAFGRNLTSFGFHPLF